jgi:hypothetical protein
MLELVLVYLKDTELLDPPHAFVSHEGFDCAVVWNKKAELWQSSSNKTMAALMKRTETK